MRIKNLPSIESMDGSQDALVIEQTDGSEDKSRKVSPAQIKQYVLGNSIDDVYSVMGQNGAKNLIPYPYYRPNGYEHRSVTYTVDSNGKITANGTATGGNSYFEMRNATYETFNLKPNTRYIISGCPSGGGESTYLLSVSYRLGGGTATTLALDFGNGAEFTTPQNADANYTISVRIVSGTATTNLLFEPMLRLASDTDSTYQPYAKTNRQLTEAIGDLSQTGLTGNSVADQLTTAKGQITGKAEKNPSAFSDYTDQRLYAAAAGMTLTDIKGGYKVKDGICYVFMQVSFTGSFGTPGAWNFIGGFPASAVDGIPIIAVPTNNDTNTVALRGGRMNTTGSLFIINESTLTGDNSTAFTFIGSYPVANP